MELLPKNFCEFRHYFQVSRSSSQTRIWEAYSEYEAQRKAKLAAAQRQRTQMKQMERSLPTPAAHMSALSPGRHAQATVWTRSTNANADLVHLPYKVHNNYVQHARMPWMLYNIMNRN